MMLDRRSIQARDLMTAAVVAERDGKKRSRWEMLVEALALEVRCQQGRPLGRSGVGVLSVEPRPDAGP